MLSFIVLLLAQAVEVYANGRNMPTARFINPEPAGPDSEYENNPVYKVGDTVEFRWFTTLDKVGIIMWQQHPDLNAGRNIDLLGNIRSLFSCVNILLTRHSGLDRRHA